MSIRSLLVRIVDEGDRKKVGGSVGKVNDADLGLGSFLGHLEEGRRGVGGKTRFVSEPIRLKNG